MKAIIIAGLVSMTALLAMLIPRAKAQAEGEKAEYVTIRWGGRENTHLVRANGKVEFLGPILTKVPRPDRVDDRAFYMNIAMNAVANEGYEFAGMTHDEIVMKRPSGR